MLKTLLKESWQVVLVFLKIFLLLVYVAMVLTVAVHLCDNFPLSSTNLNLQPNGLSPVARACISLCLWVFACGYFPIFIWAILKRLGGEAMYLYRELATPQLYPVQAKVKKTAPSVSNSHLVAVSPVKISENSTTSSGEQTGGDSL